MNIGVNTRFLVKDRLEGFGWFTYEVMKRIAKNHPEHQFYFFFDRKPDTSFQFCDNVKLIHLRPPARRPFLFKIWFNYSITLALKRYKCSLFFSPDGYLSLKTKVKQIGVIHDINFEHHPEDLPEMYSKYLRKYFPKFAQKADHIITVSQYSKTDIQETYDIPSSKISVAHNGVNTAFTPQPESLKAMTRKKYTQGNPYFLFVGALHPRKNVSTLLKAFDEFKKITRNNLSLVIVGAKYWGNEDMEKIYEHMTFKNKVIFTDHVPQSELIRIMGSAEALIYPSYYEGFGIPIIEAMRSGTPVICSDATVHPEIAGEAALFFKPHDTDALIAQMSRLAKDQILKNELIEKGIKNAQKFSWDFTAEAVWKVLSSSIAE